MTTRLTLLVGISLAACGPSAAPQDGPGSTGSGSGSGPGSGTTGDAVYVYAHTAQVLYRVDPDTLAVSQVGPFGWPSGSDEMTDIAIDKTGSIVGVSETAVYRVDPDTAACTLLSRNLAGSFNGLSFVPAEMLGQTGDDVLVGTRGDDGVVDRIDPQTGAVTQIGDMGGAFTSSGDLVAVAGFGTVQTAAGDPDDVLVRLAPMTFTATALGTSTGYEGIFGLAFWKGEVFGFTQGGDFVTIDPDTGHATLVQSGGPSWYGAGVTTLAPTIL